MIILKEKKGLSCSLTPLKFLLLGDMIITQGKTNFPKKQWPKFLEGTYVPKFLAIIIISYLFLYRLVTYHSKVLEESYNFVVEKTLIKTQMQKL